MDVRGFWVGVVNSGFSWDDVGDDWFYDCWLAIFEMCILIFLMGRFMFIVISFDEKN